MGRKKGINKERERREGMRREKGYKEEGKAGGVRHEKEKEGRQGRKRTEGMRDEGEMEEGRKRSRGVRRGRKAGRQHGYPLGVFISHFPAI